MKTPDFVSTVTKLVKRNSPEILTALAVSGVFSTSYLVGKASVTMAKDEDVDPWASNKERVKKYWRLYIPAGVSGALTIACIIGSSKANSRRAAAAVTAYSITEKAFSEYREKVVEEIGKGKEQKIRDKVAQDHVSENPVGGKEVIVIGGGHVLCCELYTRRYFRSDMETLRKAQNDINAKIVNEIYVTLSEFYDRIGLSNTSNSDNLGWDSNKLMELEFSTVLSDDGDPCLAFDYNYIKPL